MLGQICKYGSAAGLVVAVPLFTMTVLDTWHPSGLAGMVFGYLIMLVALSAVFLAIKQHRDEACGGVIRFWPALALGLGVALIASLFYVAAWEAALAISGKDFAAEYARALVASQEASGVSGLQLARFRAEMEGFRQSYASPLFRLPMTFTEIFPVGVLVSVVSAALLRNNRFLPARRSADGARGSA